MSMMQRKLIIYRISLLWDRKIKDDTQDQNTVYLQKRNVFVTRMRLFWLARKISLIAAAVQPGKMFKAMTSK